MPILKRPAAMPPPKKSAIEPSKGSTFSKQAVHIGKVAGRGKKVG